MSALHTLTLRQVLLGAAAVVVLASGLFGGLAAAAPDGPAELTAGEQVSAAPFDLTIERARWVSDLGEDVATPRGRYVALVATVENTSDHPVHVGTLSDAVRLKDVEGIYTTSFEDTTGPSEDADPQVLLLSDGTSLSPVAPGLTFEVVLLWDQSTAVEPPTEVGVVVNAQTWRTSRIDEQEYWFDATPTHVGTFEVREGAES